MKRKGNFRSCLTVLLIGLLLAAFSVAQVWATDSDSSSGSTAQRDVGIPASDIPPIIFPAGTYSSELPGVNTQLRANGFAEETSASWGKQILKGKHYADKSRDSLSKVNDVKSRLTALANTEKGQNPDTHDFAPTVLNSKVDQISSQYDDQIEVLQSSISSLKARKGELQAGLVPSFLVLPAGITVAVMLDRVSSQISDLESEVSTKRTAKADAISEARATFNQDRAAARAAYAQRVAAVEAKYGIHDDYIDEIKAVEQYRVNELQQLEQFYKKQLGEDNRKIHELEEKFHYDSSWESIASDVLHTAVPPLRLAEQIPAMVDSVEWIKTEIDRIVAGKDRFGVLLDDFEELIGAPMVAGLRQMGLYNDPNHVNRNVEFAMTKFRNFEEIRSTATLITDRNTYMRPSDHHVQTFLSNLRVMREAFNFLEHEGSAPVDLENYKKHIVYAKIREHSYNAFTHVLDYKYWAIDTNIRVESEDGYTMTKYLIDFLSNPLVEGTFLQPYWLGDEHLDGRPTAFVYNNQDAIIVINEDLNLTPEALFPYYLEEVGALLNWQRAKYAGVSDIQTVFTSSDRGARLYDVLALYDIRNDVYNEATLTDVHAEMVPWTRKRIALRAFNSRYVTETHGGHLRPIAKTPQFHIILEDYGSFVVFRSPVNGKLLELQSGTDYRLESTGREFNDLTKFYRITNSNNTVSFQSYHDPNRYLQANSSSGDNRLSLWRTGQSQKTKFTMQSRPLPEPNSIELIALQPSPDPTRPTISRSPGPVYTMTQDPKWMKWDGITGVYPQSAEPDYFMFMEQYDDYVVFRNRYNGNLLKTTGQQSTHNKMIFSGDEHDRFSKFNLIHNSDETVSFQSHFDPDRYLQAKSGWRDNRLTLWQVGIDPSAKFRMESQGKIPEKVTMVSLKGFGGKYVRGLSATSAIPLYDIILERYSTFVALRSADNGKYLRPSGRPGHVRWDGIGLSQATKFQLVHNANGTVTFSSRNTPGTDEYLRVVTTTSGGRRDFPLRLRSEKSPRTEFVMESRYSASRNARLLHSKEIALQSYYRRANNISNSWMVAANSGLGALYPASDEPVYCMVMEHYDGGYVVFRNPINGNLLKRHSFRRSYKMEWDGHEHNEDTMFSLIHNSDGTVSFQSYFDHTRYLQADSGWGDDRLTLWRRGTGLKTKFTMRTQKLIPGKKTRIALGSAVNSVLGYYTLTGSSMSAEPAYNVMLEDYGSFVTLRNLSNDKLLKVDDRGTIDWNGEIVGPDTSFMLVRSSDKTVSFQYGASSRKKYLELITNWDGARLSTSAPYYTMRSLDYNSHFVHHLMKVPSYDRFSPIVLTFQDNSVAYMDGFAGIDHFGDCLAGGERGMGVLISHLGFDVPSEYRGAAERFALQLVYFAPKLRSKLDPSRAYDPSDPNDSAVPTMVLQLGLHNDTNFFIGRFLDRAKKADQAVTDEVATDADEVAARGAYLSSQELIDGGLLLLRHHGVELIFQKYDGDNFWTYRHDQFKYYKEAIFRIEADLRLLQWLIRLGDGALRNSELYRTWYEGLSTTGVKLTDGVVKALKYLNIASQTTGAVEFGMNFKFPYANKTEFYAALALDIGTNLSGAIIGAVAGAVTEQDPVFWAEMGSTVFDFVATGYDRLFLDSVGSQWIALSVSVPFDYNMAFGGKQERVGSYDFPQPVTITNPVYEGADQPVNGMNGQQNFKRSTLARLRGIYTAFNGIFTIYPRYVFVLVSNGGSYGAVIHP